MSRKRGGKSRRPKGEAGHSYEEISEAFVSVEAFRSAPGWMRGDPGRLRAVVVVTCAACGHVLAEVFRPSSPDLVADAQLHSRGPLPVESTSVGTERAVFVCTECGARPQVRVDRMADKVAEILVVGKATKDTFAI